MTGPGELGAVSSGLVRTLPCPPAVPQQTSHFHFPREATRPNKPEQGLSVCTGASLICCLVSSFKCVWGQEKIAPAMTQARPSFWGGRLGESRFASGSVLGLPTSPPCVRLVFGRQSAAMPGQHQFKPCQESAPLPGSVL
uniref:Uncharacterized protein n=1 Tax=Myotis myotis TaxID=51298 RepID=A0A7J7Z530_MYOMY|nr:hypothetical protein mMyoMyo1_010667 [Myotis myotis]